MTASGYNLYKKSARDAQYELIERYAPLVKRIAYHLLARLPASVQVEDLIQELDELLGDDAEEEDEVTEHKELGDE